MNKVLFLDLETTGLNPKLNGVIQIAGLVEVDGIVVEEFSCNVAPFKNDKIDDKALEVNKLTEQQIKGFPQPGEIFKANLSGDGKRQRHRLAR